MLDSTAMMAQVGALLSVGGEAVSILGRNPAGAGGSAVGFTVAEGMCLILGVASEIVATSIQE